MYHSKRKNWRNFLMSKKCYFFSSGVRCPGQICMHEVFSVLSSFTFRTE